MWFLLACRPDQPPPPPPDADGVVLDGSTLRLFREGQLLLSLPAEQIELGLVDAYEEAKSYDPFWPNDLATGGVSWQPVRGLTGALPELELEFDALSATLTVSEDAPGRFSLHLVPQGPAPVALFRLGLDASPEEAFYGLGSALDTPNRRGSLRAVQLELDPATEAFNNEAHVHVPLFLGTTGWATFVRDDHPMTVSFGTELPELVEITVGTGPDSSEGLRWEWYTADHPLDLTAQYWQSTGHHRLPARWAYGPWHWRDENEDQAEVEQDMRTLRELDLATTGVWIDRPYASGVNTFDFEPERFPDPASMIALAHELGFRVALWHTPYVAEQETGSLYVEAETRGYFPPVHPPSFIDWGTPLDFSNPDAYAWWQSLLGDYDALGIEGYKLDYAEEVLLGAFGGRLPWLFSDGSDERTMHAHYQRLYHQVYAEMLPEDGGFLLCRTGVWGDQVNGPIIWPGDLDATLDDHGTPTVDREGEAYVAVGGLPAALVDALSLGPSGFPFYASDTGGYRHSPPDNETFIRWFQQTALSSVMQVGNSTNDVVWEPDEVNGFDEDTLDSFRAFTRLHLRLFPYVWSYAAEIGQGRGRPILRPLGLAFPALGVHPGDEYLLGDHLLVAPVVHAGVREREVIFPPGRWMDWFDGEIHEEGTELVSAELHELPLYLGEGAIVPLLRPTIDTLSPTTSPDLDSYATTPGVLWVRLWSGPATASTLYDGTRIEQDEGTILWQGGSEFQDGALLELLAEPEPGSVTLDGVELQRRSSLAEVEASGGYTWDGTLWVRVPAEGRELRVR
jgi:alpha-D-xyloside xylohydrolase